MYDKAIYIFQHHLLQLKPSNILIPVYLSFFKNFKLQS